MAEPTTISNLPQNLPARWEENQKLLKETTPIITEAALVSQLIPSEVSQTSPLSQIELLVGIFTHHPTWALFGIPKGFSTQTKRLFTSRLTSLLESDEQYDSLTNRIERVNKMSDSKEEETTLLREKGMLLTLLKLLKRLNKDLIDILSRCKQYQKG